MKIAIVMGSDTDFPVMENGLKLLEKFGVEYEIRVLSAHRTPHLAAEYAAKAEENGIEVIIGVAGMAAHLAGVLAGVSCLPVIGVPVKTSALEGMDALLATVQMPPGVPVATVGIDNGVNAVLLAIQMLSIKYDELRVKYKDYKQEMVEKVVAKDKKLNEKLLNK